MILTKTVNKEIWKNVKQYDQAKEQKTYYTGYDKGVMITKKIHLDFSIV